MMGPESCCKNVRWLALLGIVLTPAALGEELTARPAILKPAHSEVDFRYRDDVVSVQFVDGSNVRLRAGRLVASGTRGLDELHARLPGGAWVRPYNVSEAQLDTWRGTAARNLGREVADLNLHYYYFLPEGSDVAAVLGTLNALPGVEIALPVPRPVLPPTPPNYQPSQGYRNPATRGIDADGMAALPGGTGGAVAIADLEYSWNLAHGDFPVVTLLGATPNDPFNDNNHGTGVLGELIAMFNGWGVTGATYGSMMYVVATNTGAGSGVWDVGGAITTALGTLGPGDVILIEQQYPGPNYTGSPPGTQAGLVPVEWYQPWYNAIVTAVGNGVIVVEAAGNGSENLDAAVYSTGNGGHWPFLPQNDSGAIIVGAGAAPALFNGSDTARSRLGFSNYGSTVDLQGWGESVVTTCCGDLYSAEGVNLYYTSGFSGTSSASPIVASACALLSSAYKTATGLSLAPAAVRQYLVSTGSPQQAGTYPVSQNIGPLPDTTSAFSTLLVANDCNHNGIFDSVDIASGTSHDCNFDGVPDECQPPFYLGGSRLYVDSAAPGLNTGASWVDAYRDLTTALCVAASNASVREIWVARSTPYCPRAGFYASDPRTATFPLVSGVAVYGGFLGWEFNLGQRLPQVNVTVLSGDLRRDDLPGFGNTSDNAYHVVTASGCDATAVLDGFTVRAGEATGVPGQPLDADSGGGVFARNGGPTIRGCTIEQNRAIAGGGLALIVPGSALLDNCLVQNNQSLVRGGGGGWLDSGGQPTVRQSQFSGNSAFGGGDGGGLLCTDNVAVTIDACLFELNNANGGGGGVAIGGDDGCQPQISDTVLHANTAQLDGGGLLTLYAARPHVNACRFVANTTSSSGAGAGARTSVVAYGAAPTFTNCIFTGNQAIATGGGVDVAPQTYATVTNCSFAFNHAPAGTSVSFRNTSAASGCTITNSILWNMGGVEVFESLPNPPLASVTYCDVRTPRTGTGNIYTDPAFADADGLDNMPGSLDDNLRIRGSSPVIDAGDDDADTDMWQPGVQALPAADFGGRTRCADQPYVMDTGNAGIAGAPVVDMGAYEFLMGDFDFDGAIGPLDFGLLEACLSGPDVFSGAGCVEQDITRDNDTDMQDFAEFQLAFGR